MTKSAVSFIFCVAQGTRNKNTFSKRSNMLHMFNIEIDLFYECEERDVVSYADDTTQYSSGTHTQSVIAELQVTANKFFHWFQYKHLKPTLVGAIYL